MTLVLHASSERFEWNGCHSSETRYFVVTYLWTQRMRVKVKYRESHTKCQVIVRWPVNEWKNAKNEKMKNNRMQVRWTGVTRESGEKKVIQRKWATSLHVCSVSLLFNRCQWLFVGECVLLLLEMMYCTLVKGAMRMCVENCEKEGNTLPQQRVGVDERSCRVIEAIEGIVSVVRLTRCKHTYTHTQKESALKIVTWWESCRRHRHRLRS